jgi:type IV pilus assembly protein PilQ
MHYRLIITLVFLLSCNFTFSQRNNKVLNKIEELSKTKTALNDVVRIDLTGLTLYDFISTLAEEHKLNVSVDANLNQIVSGNFFDVNVKDVLFFLIKKHNLEVDIQNNILIFNKKKIVEEKKKIEPIKQIDVRYNDKNDFLSVKLKNDSLVRVAQAITDVSKKNIVLAPGVKNLKVSAYILNRPFDQVLEMTAKSNKLIVTKDENNNYYLDNNREVLSNTKSKSVKKKSDYVKGFKGSYSVDIDKDGFINIKALEADAADIIIEVAEKLNINFFMYDIPVGLKTTLIAYDLTYDDFLENVFNGKKYTFKKTDDLYLIGEHKTKGLRNTVLIQLENRSIENVKTTLPKFLTQNLEVKEFMELNGFVVSGSKNHIQEFKDYIYEIDIIVPVIQIEVIIVQYKKSYEIQTGMQAGIDKTNSTTTGGVLFPTTDVSLDATSVNGLIDAFNGLGLINLGKVTKDFYLNLNFLENNSLIKTSSTPKLVTLNGHDASSSIGQTSYYFEQNNRLINTGVNNNILQSGTWKSTEANLSINIKPFVSTSEDVTLTIKVERSSFLGRAGENAPPDKATQKFESMIRVKNNEMILLGGLDELENENSGTGTPFLSRIPIIKWFFSGRNKRKEKSKLHIFIKPTVTY